MKLNYWFVGFVTVATLSPSSSGLTQITSNKSQIPSKNQSIEYFISQGALSKKDTLVFGLREDVRPISYPDGNGGRTGYCIEFLKSLERYLTEKTGSHKKIEMVAVARENRFTGKGNNKETLDGECGPNTITKDREENLKKIKGIFSNSFASTGASFLVKNENVKHFYEKDYLKEKRIGVLESTTTKPVVQQVYPRANIEDFSSDDQAIKKLENDDIFAYASDRILLKGILETSLYKKKTDFSILPFEKDISYEEYGMVVYQDNKELLEHINNFLKSELAKNLRKEYLDENNTILDSIYVLYYEKKWFIYLVIVIFIVGLAGGLFLSIVFRFLKRKSDVDTLNLYHGEDVDPHAIAISFKKLTESHPDAELQIVGMEVQGKDEFLLRAKAVERANLSELREEYYSRYKHFKDLAQQELKPLIAEKDIRIRCLENMIATALQRPRFYAENYHNQGNTMPEAPKSEYNFHDSVGSVANQGHIASSGNENTIGNAAGNVEGDQKSIQHNYAPEQRQTLAEAAAEIQQLLKQLEQTNPTATEAQQIEHINDETTPKFKKRVVGALQATGEAAIDEFVLENKYLKVVKAAIKGWVKPE